MSQKSPQNWANYGILGGKTSEEKSHILKVLEVLKGEENKNA